MPQCIGLHFSNYKIKSQLMLMAQKPIFHSLKINSLVNGQRSLEVIIKSWRQALIQKANMQPNKKRDFKKITSMFYVDDTALLGEGQFGQVYAGWKSDERKEIAVKIFREEAMASNWNILMREIEILQKLKQSNHPNLVRYYGNIQKDSFMYLFFDICEKSLKDKLMDGPLPEKTVKAYLRDIMTGLVEIHSKGIIHRDLKPDNILIDRYGVLKLADFGLSRVIEVEGSVQLTMQVGSYAYRTPETFLNKQYDQRSDVWSAGIILYIMLTGNLCRQYQILSQKDVDKRNFDLQRGKINLFFEGYEPIWEQLLNRMLEYDSEKRATSQEILDLLQAWNNKNPLFSNFRTDVSTETVRVRPTEQKNNLKSHLQIHQTPQVHPQQQAILEQEVLSSLKYEQQCKDLLQYKQHLDYFYEVKKISQLIRERFLNLAKSAPILCSKFPNFLLLCACFCTNSMIFLRIQKILDEMSLRNVQQLLQECKQLTKFEKQRYILLRDVKKRKFESFVNEYVKTFTQVRTKLLSYRQRKQMSHFERSFLIISGEIEKIGEFSFDNIMKLFDSLYNNIDFNVSVMTISDPEAKMLYLLKVLKEMSWRFSKGYHPIALEEKNALTSRIETLEAGAIRAQLSK